MRKGWEVKRLDEICIFGNGLWTGKKPPFHKVGVIRNTNFSKDGKLDDSDIVYLDVEQSQFSKRKLQYGDIILEKSGGGPKQPVGRVIIFDKRDGDFSFSNFTSVIRIINHAAIDFNYLHSFLFFSYMSGTTETMQSHSTGIRNLKFEDYKAIKIPLPPVTEQKRIVSILDEAFAAIAKAKANAEENLKNAKELFESYLQGVFENKGEGWEEKTLKEITSKIGSGATPRGGNESYKSEGISLIRSMNVHDLKFREKNLAFIDDQQARELNNVTLQKDDVLLNITGASVARCCIIPEEYLPGRVNQHVSIIRAKQEIITPIFLCLLLTSKFYKDQLLFTGGQGATRQAITKAQLEVFIVAFPKSIKEQRLIVEKLDALLTETQRLEAIYQEKINDLEELKKTILQRAFSGELTNTISQVSPIALRKIEHISTTDLHAGLIAIAFDKHEKAGTLSTFHHVKSEKIINLISYHLGIELDRVPVKDAAGPNDYTRLKNKVEPRAAKAGFFSVRKEGEIYNYSKGQQFEKIISKASSCLGDDLEKVNALIDLLVKMNTRQAEIVATVYIAWNNLILQGKTITDEAIVTEAREDWHEAKLKIEREKFFKGLEWMRSNGLIPKGSGQVVLPKK